MDARLHGLILGLVVAAALGMALVACPSDWPVDDDDSAAGDDDDTTA